MAIVIAFACVYLFGLPLVLWFLGKLHQQQVIDKKIAKKVNPKKIPEPLFPQWKERIKFTMKDSRPIKGEAGPKRSLLFILMWVAGLLLTVAAAFTETWILALVGVVLFFTAVGFASISAKPLIETRRNILNKMFEIATMKSLVDSSVDSPSEVIQILKWENMIEPREVKFEIQSKFSDTGEEGFMVHFNQFFGTELTWVPSFDEETGATGWDYKESVLTIRTVPPLPTMAKWSERYVLDDGISWSFFPLGLGVEGGVEIPNPETGETENVLGFDVAGKQSGMKKYKCSKKIVTSPMALVAGATGGGKAEADNTLVTVWIDD